jgi:hypothetical protein
MPARRMLAGGEGEVIVRSGVVTLVHKSPRRGFMHVFGMLLDATAQVALRNKLAW